VFSSSVLNLAELVALVPLLVSCRKILYFHENQLQYPVRKDQNRDFQYGYNQILSWYVLASRKLKPYWDIFKKKYKFFGNYFF